MFVVLLVIHIIVTLLLIISVLLQESKGGGLSGVFGGGSQSMFGGQGANEFMAKITSALAILFMVTSLLLAMTSLRGGGGNVSEDIKKLQQDVQKEVNSQIPAQGENQFPGLPAGDQNDQSTSPQENNGTN